MKTNYIDWLKTVDYTEDLDGGGRYAALIFEKFLKDIKVDTCYEWCCGPAWIGLWLLEIGVCKELIVSDINPKAIDCVNRTIEKHKYNAKAYVSDNLNDVPEQKFDLVVASPPNYKNIQKSHPLGHMKGDLRASDVDWKIHKAFYKDIKDYLHSESELYISEVEPYNEIVVLNDSVYDVRDVIPIKEFVQMVDDNGLCINKVLMYEVANINTAEEYRSLQMGILHIKKFNEKLTCVYDS